MDATLAVKGAVGQIGKSENDRVNAMAAANAGYDGYKAYEAVKALPGQISDTVKSIQNGGTGAPGQTVVNVSATFGSNTSENTTETNTTQSVASNVKAGGNVIITATGGGEQSNVLVEGSHIEAGGDTTIAADHNITLKSAKDTKDETTSNKSLGFTVGVNAAIGTGDTGVNVTGGVDYAKGKTEEHTVTNSNTTVKSGGTTTLRSGDTTTISGARVEGDRVEVDAKELKIESPQDTSSYKGDQKNLSVNVSVSVTGGGGSVGGSLNKSNVSSDFKSVGEQSGILAGDGGYKINVKDNTDLKGGVINSTNPDASSINTGSLTISDIQNQAEYHAGGSGINIGAGAFQGVGIKPTGSAGFGSDGGGDSGVTRGGINIPGYNSGSISNPFDAARVRKESETQVAVTQEFSKNSQEVYEAIEKKILQDKIKKYLAKYLNIDEKHTTESITLKSDENPRKTIYRAILKKIVAVDMPDVSDFVVNLALDQLADSNYYGMHISHKGLCGGVCEKKQLEAIAAVGGKFGTLDPDEEMVTGLSRILKNLHQTTNQIDQAVQGILLGIIAGSTKILKAIFAEEVVTGGSKAVATVEEGIAGGSKAVAGAEEGIASGGKAAARAVEAEAGGVFIPKSFEEIVANPKALFGKSADEVGSLLGDGWTRGTYGSGGTGWKFTKGDKSVFYHPGGGRHGGSYYGFSSSKLGKNKVVGSDYIPVKGDKATIIQNK